MPVSPSLAARIVGIADPGDPRVADYRDIRDRDLVARGGFIAEGTVVLDHLLRSTRFRPTSLFLLKSRVAGLDARLSRVPPDVPIYVAERPVMDQVAGFAVHRGVLAHAMDRRAGDAPGGTGADTDRDAGEPRDLQGFLESSRRKGGPLVVAIGLANHDNVGAIFRNAAAFGASGVVLDATSCHPLYRKAIRVAVGTSLTLPFHHGAPADAIVERLEASGHHPLALSPRGRRRLAEMTGKPGLALVLGSEGGGLPERLMRRAETVRIEMAPGIDSLNVATAAAIVLARLYSAA
ncbi:TrmH family RNA methyltransferase [Jiella sonneratiae]|uniref:RNA methyltransferase n=1 Tax=Jiella sonneratiae TaxID=2816856 RepID=A0ABS3J8V0_9HYPH|nr:RNA methyltransferase [Jiella sonneratiae]MBO0905542.1 RNA methyltransferase [Jiella sonneratiae]